MESLPALYFGLLLIVNIFNKRCIISVSNLLMGLYFAGSLCFLILSHFEHFDLYIDASIYYLGALSFFIIPHLFFDEKKIEFVKTDLNAPKLKLLFLCFFLSQFVCIIYFLPQVFRAVTGDILANRLLVNQSEWVGGGYVALFFALIGSAWPLSLTMFFFSIVNGARASYCIMFLLCSFSGAVYVLAHVGRAGILYWLMGFAFNYLLFRQSILFRKRRFRSVFRRWKFSKRIAIIAVFVFFVFFGLISQGRHLGDKFGTGPYSGQLLMAVEYAGQAYGYFNDYYSKNWLADKVYLGQYSGSLFCGILEQLHIIPPYNYATVLLDVFSYHYRSGLKVGTFNTLLKEITIDFGLWNSFAIYAIYFLVSLRMTLKWKGKWDLSKILLYSFAFSIPYYGFFFFSYGNSLANATAIYYILASLLARRYLKTQSTVPERYSKSPADINISRGKVI